MCNFYQSKKGRANGWIERVKNVTYHFQAKNEPENSMCFV